MKFSARLAKLLRPTRVAHAHCDVPCGLYDPAAAVMAANTVAVMVQKITDLQAPGPSTSPEDRKAFLNTMARMVATKEEHAQLCKKELLILWTDYFKPEHLQRFPDLHTTFWNAAKLCSANKQNVSMAAAKQLQDAVNNIADMFWKSKQ